MNNNNNAVINTKTNRNSKPNALKLKVRQLKNTSAMKSANGGGNSYGSYGTYGTPRAGSIL